MKTCKGCKRSYWTHKVLGDPTSPEMWLVRDVDADGNMGGGNYIGEISHCPYCGDRLLKGGEAEERGVRLPDGRLLVKCPECDGIGALPTRPGKKTPEFCTSSQCNMTGYWIENDAERDALKEASAATWDAGCDTCGGSRRVPVHSPQGAWMPCPKCEGTDEG